MVVLAADTEHMWARQIDLLLGKISPCHIAIGDQATLSGTKSTHVLSCLNDLPVP
jgi:hypothetical protein